MSKNKMLVPSIADFYPLELPMMRPANAAFGVAGAAVYRTVPESAALHPRYPR